jgi:hypothetical protein
MFESTIYCEIRDSHSGKCLGHYCLWCDTIHAGNFMLLYITSQKTVMLPSTDTAACSLLLCFHVESCLVHVFILSCPCFMYFSHFVILSCHLFTTFSLWSETDLPLSLHNTGTFQQCYMCVNKWSRQVTNLHNALQKSTRTCP